MKNKEGIWRLEYLEPPINEDLDEQNDLNDDQILKLFFGKIKKTIFYISFQTIILKKIDSFQRNHSELYQ